MIMVDLIDSGTFRLKCKHVDDCEKALEERTQVWKSLRQKYINMFKKMTQSPVFLEWNETGFRKEN